MRRFRDTTEKFITFAIAVVLCGSLWRLFSTGTTQSAQNMEGDDRTQIVLALVYIVVVILCVLQFRAIGRAFLRNPMLIAILGLAFVSAAWAESPDLVARRAFGLVGASLFGVFLGIRFSFDEQLRLLRWAFRLAAVGTVALLILSPSRALSAPGGGGAFRGIFPHKNILGAVMALAFIVEWYLRDERAKSKVLRLFSLCVYGGLVAISNSMSSILTVIATLAAVWVVRVLCGRHRIPVAAVAAFGILLAVAVTVAGVQTGDILGVLGRSSDLTGRTELWSAVTEAIQEKPLLGYGFSGFWKGASPESQIVEGQIQWTPAYSHNGYLEILLSLGIVGFALAAVFLTIGFKRAWNWSRAGDSAMDTWPLAVLMFVVIHNLTECSIVWQNCLEWSVCIATIVAADPALYLVPKATAKEKISVVESETNPEWVAG